MMILQQIIKLNNKCLCSKLCRSRWQSFWVQVATIASKIFSKLMLNAFDRFNALDCAW